MTLHHDKKSYGKISTTEELSVKDIDKMLNELNETTNKNSEEKPDKPKRCDKVALPVGKATTK